MWVLCYELNTYFLSSPQIYRRHRKRFSVERNNATELVSKAAGEIERLLSKRTGALKVSHFGTSPTPRRCHSSERLQ